MNRIENNCSEICPRCGKNNLNYHWNAVSFNYDLMYVPFSCEDCGLNGKEISSVEFIMNEAWVNE